MSDDKPVSCGPMTEAQAIELSEAFKAARLEPTPPLVLEGTIGLYSLEDLVQVADRYNEETNYGDICAVLDFIEWVREDRDGIR